MGGMFESVVRDAEVRVWKCLLEYLFIRDYVGEVWPTTRTRQDGLPTSGITGHNSAKTCAVAKARSQPEGASHNEILR